MAKKIAPEFASTKLDDQTQNRVELVKLAYTDLLDKIRQLTPPSRDQSIAITELEKSCMFATRAVARAPSGVTPKAEGAARALVKPVVVKQMSGLDGKPLGGTEKKEG